MKWYNREGQLIDATEAARLSRDIGYKVVQQTELDDPLVLVSTVWLGLDHNHSNTGRPLIFETMVFRRWTKEMEGLSELTGGPTGPLMLELAVARYSTEAEAEAGHDKMVNEWRGKPMPEPTEWELNFLE